VKIISRVDRYRPQQVRHFPISDGSSPHTLQRHTNSTSSSLSTHIITGVDKLHAEGYTGKGITIAVLDTGVDYLNPALGGCFGPGCKIPAGYDYVGDDYDGSNTPVPDDDPFTSCSPHGTHVSGIIGANENEFGFRGVAPDAEIHMYRVFGCDGYTTDDLLVNVSLTAYDSGVDIITASIGGSNGWSESESSSLLFLPCFK
jgi:subtilisin family serine protease